MTQAQPAGAGVAWLQSLPAIPERGGLPPSGEVDVWYCQPEQIREPERLQRYYGWLSPEETERQQRYYFDRDRHLYLVAKALVRRALSHYAAVSPEQWVFELNDYGKPFIVAPKQQVSLYFNLSHTHGLAACAVAAHEPLGVDVEHVARRTEPIAIADRFFSADEVRALHAQPSARQSTRFFAYWTLKEAYIKARGMGLAIPLGHFSFDVDTPGLIGIDFAPELEDQPARWQFQRYAVTREHVLALALGDAPAPMRVFAHQLLP